MSEQIKSAPKSEPTPTPWEVERHTNGVIFITSSHSHTGDIADLYHVHLYKHEEGVIIRKDNADANADLIVRAVNAHGDLVHIVQHAIEILSRDDIIANNKGQFLYAAKKAIAKARGEQS